MRYRLSVCLKCLVISYPPRPEGEGVCEDEISLDVKVGSGRVVVNEACRRSLAPFPPIRLFAFPLHQEYPVSHQQTRLLMLLMLVHFLQTAGDEVICVELATSCKNSAIISGS